MFTFSVKVSASCDGQSGALSSSAIAPAIPSSPSAPSCPSRLTETLTEKVNKAERAFPTPQPWISVELAVPVAFEGRFCPLKTYCQTLSSRLFGIAPKGSEELLFNVYYYGYQQLTLFEQFTGDELTLENEMKQAVRQMESQGLTSRQIAHTIERDYPLRSRLNAAGFDFCMLPSRFESGKWYSLKALCCTIYDPRQGALVPVGNFTAYPDPLFDTIRKAYLEKESRRLLDLLAEGYRPLAGKVHTEAVGKLLHYPTQGQLKAELFYRDWPLANLVLISYVFSFLFFIAARLGRLCKGAALALLGIGFLIHTLMLGLRCYILSRPPVSNMFETIIYVPWVATLAGFGLAARFRATLILSASAGLGAVLFTLLKATSLEDQLAPLQPVLDSQYWLLVHVLMVVGSYSFFLLAGLLGHLYLLRGLRQHPAGHFTDLGRLILQAIYIGTALLIPGTILGGVWAAQSWGRFWDWDPKESWAFISAAFYLAWIHAFRSQYISYFGLAAGAVVGLMVISFTWYGVNYILGTGLHSYGFGVGGEHYYWLFLCTESAFLAYIWLASRVLKKSKIER